MSWLGLSVARRLGRVEPRTRMHGAWWTHGFLRVSKPGLGMAWEGMGRGSE